MCEALLAVRQRTRGPLGIGSRRDRRAARFSGKARQPPAPPRVHALAPKRRTVGRRQDDDRSDRRGATGSAGVEAEFDAPVDERLCMRFRRCSASRMGFGLLTALLTITRKSDYLRAVWDGDRL